MSIPGYKSSDVSVYFFVWHPKYFLPSTMLLDPGREILFQVLGSKTQHPVHGVVVDGRELGYDIYCKSSFKALSFDL